MKAGFLSLGLALLIEALLARPADVLPGLPNTALHLGAIHLLTVGWLLQLISGVAYWMFPRHPTAPPRGDERLGWVAFGCLNGGLALRLAGEVWRLGMRGPAWPLVTAALLQLVAVALLVALLWPRVRELPQLMPRLTVWMLRTSLLALLAGTALGAWLLGTEPGYDLTRAGLRDLHLWLLLFGWLVQFVLGVAYWMLPRYAVAPDRGPPWVGWTAYGLFVAGLALHILALPLPGNGLAPAGRLCLTGAAFTFLLLLWGRVKPFGTR